MLLVSYLNTYCFHPYVDSPEFLLLQDQCSNRFRLIDNLDSARVDNIPDIPRLSTNEKVGAGGVAAESGRMDVADLFTPDNAKEEWQVLKEESEAKKSICVALRKRSFEVQKSICIMLLNSHLVCRSPEFCFNHQSYY